MNPCVYNPKNPREMCPVIGVDAPGVYDLTDEQVTLGNSLIEGRDGAPAFVPVAPKVATSVGPVDHTVKRGPGRPPKADKAEPVADKAEG